MLLEWRRRYRAKKEPEMMWWLVSVAAAPWIENVPPLPVYFARTYCMADVDEDDIRLANELYEKWDHGRGISKSQLEIKTWNDATSHGRRFDRFVSRAIGASTTTRSRQSNRIADLERQVRSSGGHPAGFEPPEWEVQLQHSRDSCVQALRVWNDPASNFRTGAFALLFVTAWNSLAVAVIARDGRDWRTDPELGDSSPSKRTHDLIDDAFPGEARLGLRENAHFWVNIRNAVAHRCLPALDTPVIPFAQAGLLNFDDVVTNTFGAEYSIGDNLSVPLQLAGFRDPGVLAARKKMFGSLPLDVQAVLTRAGTVDADLLGDPTFSLRVAFVPFTPNSATAPDVVAHFVKPGEVPEDVLEALGRHLIVVPKTVRSAAQLKATEVFASVSKRTGFKFSSIHHVAVARHLGAWPAVGTQISTVNERLAEYNTAFKAWLYTPAWVNLLVSRLASADDFEELTGRRAAPLATGDPPDAPAAPPS
jgi:hypothetical protein